MPGDPVIGGQIVPHLFTRPLDAHQTGFAFGEVLAHVNHMLGRGNCGWKLMPVGWICTARSDGRLPGPVLLVPAASIAPHGPAVTSALAARRVRPE